MKPNTHARSYSIATLALIYLVLRFGFTRQLDALGPYAAYLMEVGFVIIALGIVGRPSLRAFKLPRAAFYYFPLALAAGYGIFIAAGYSGVPIPFDLVGTETVLFLLLVAPILEELIFRFLLWQPVQALTGRAWLALIFTAFLFSYSHLHAIWFVPPVIHSFIIYQTAYTLALGVACGYFVYRYNSVTGAMMIHFAFNLGFYLASRF